MSYFAGYWNEVLIFPFKKYFVACSLNITEPDQSQANVSWIQVSTKHYN